MTRLLRAIAQLWRQRGERRTAAPRVEAWARHVHVSTFTALRLPPFVFFSTRDSARASASQHVPAAAASTCAPGALQPEPRTREWRVIPTHAGAELL